jgi:integrase
VDVDHEGAGAANESVPLLRHTFASILVALGVDPGSVMDQLGHADPGFTLRVYRHGMRRDDAARESLQALVGKGSRQL